MTFVTFKRRSDTDGEGKGRLNRIFIAYSFFFLFFYPVFYPSPAYRSRRVVKYVRRNSTKKPYTIRVGGSRTVITEVNGRAHKSKLRSSSSSDRIVVQPSNGRPPRRRPPRVPRHRRDAARTFFLYVLENETKKSDPLSSTPVASFVGRY